MADIIITSPTTFFIDGYLWSINRQSSIQSTFNGDGNIPNGKPWYADQVYQISDIQNPAEPKYSFVAPLLQSITVQTINRLRPDDKDLMTLPDYYDWADTFIEENGFVLDKRIGDLVQTSKISIWSILDTWYERKYPLLSSPSSYLLLQVTADEDTVMLAKLSFDTMTINLNE